MRIRLLIPALAVAALTMTGCAVDKHVQASTPSLPATIELVDTLTDEVVWSYDIPVGHQLVYNFQYSSSHPEVLKNPEVPADSMDWWLYRGDTQSNYRNYAFANAIEKDTVALTGNPVLVKVSYRETGRTVYPPSLTSPGEAAALPPIRLELAVYEDGSFDFDGTRRTTDDLGPLFQSVYGERKVIVTGKPGTPRANLEALRATIQRPDLVTVVVPPAIGEQPEAPTEPETPSEPEAPAESGDPVDLLEGAMEDK